QQDRGDFETERDQRDDAPPAMVGNPAEHQQGAKQCKGVDRKDQGERERGKAPLFAIDRVQRRWRAGCGQERDNERTHQPQPLAMAHAPGARCGDAWCYGGRHGISPSNDYLMDSLARLCRQKKRPAKDTALRGSRQWTRVRGSPQRLPSAACFTSSAAVSL